MWLITQLRANIPRCAAKIQIFSQTNVKMFRFSLYLQQFNVFSRLSATISPIIRCESKGISHIMQANFVNASIHFAVVLPLLHNDDAKQMQIESRTCQACLGNYAEMQLCLSKVSTNPSTCPNLVCNPPTLVCKHSILHVQTPNNC